jgi:hypothetical protein
MNTYAYAEGNPLKYIDPYGLYTTISFDPSAASGFGHVGIGVNIGDTVGQRPQDNASDIKALFGHNVPGEISPDPHTGNSYTVTLPTTPTQDANIQQCIDDRQQRQEYYDLYNNNCAQFVQQCLGAGGINVPNTVFPAHLFQSVGGQILD